MCSEKLGAAAQPKRAMKRTLCDVESVQNDTALFGGDTNQHMNSH